MSSTAKTAPLVFNASSVARAHTILASLAFLTAFVVGSFCHYKKIVQNGVAGYPQEWFPSVSATIGDWYPERNLFQLLIALTAGPRFLLIAIQYYIHSSTGSSLPGWVFLSGIIRTLTCGGWVYITSSDDHDAHDIFMISYMVCNIPWMIGGTVCTPVNRVSVRRQRFFATIIPLVYFFLQHKVHRIPGAYTRYAFFEWALIIFDVYFDSVAELEFKDAQLKNGSSPDWRLALNFLSDIYLSYVFWSIATSLLPTLFYFSIWELGIAGQELALLSALSPAFLGIAAIRKALRTRIGLLALNLLSLTGLLAFVSDSPLHRLFIVSFASAVSMIRQVLYLSGIVGSNVVYQAGIMSLGLIVSSLSKHANHSNNPVWPFTEQGAAGYNKIGLILAIVASIEHFLRGSPRSFPTSHIVPGKKISTLSAALPLGSLIFALLYFLADSSLLVAWSWTGYENGVPRGPLPHLYGSLTFIAQSLGLLVCSSLTNHIAWFLYGVASTFVLYQYRNWLGYIGGLNFSVFLMSIVPLVILRAAATPRPVLTYSVAMLIYCFLHVAWVFTVAYAFVPGGTYFRERTDLMLIAHLLMLMPAFISSGSNRPSLPQKLPGWVTTLTKRFLALVTLLSVLITLYRWPPMAVPARPGPRIVNAGIWTVHFGFNNVGRDSQEGMKTLIQDMQLDIVGLLETDLQRPSFGQRDLTRVIVEELGYNVDIGPGPNSHTWGAVLLSKFPIINSTHHLLPSPHGELAPAIEAVLDIYGTEVVVIVSHNGQEETPLDRELQGKELGRIMAAAHPRPTIFLGYVVTKPHAERPAPYKYLVDDGLVHDIDKDDMDRWCEYILYRGLYRTAYARVSRGIITDTEMQIGQFVLPRHGHRVTDESEAARYTRVQKEQLSADHWFPSEYFRTGERGGKNGHFYHVFDSPLYYQIPEGAVL
ncbi:hypothetical protein M378DRAFT_185572 [Amanita muscaria Koide BX008]|uniref:Calcofluor white hypersensitive protein n=1 Tax=Amanita muscaria (strain Koide BX008) TaxID=946122 RepID=A0A0C2XF58_AMAMK|nr:hypothetical protein M378DRAFT_185572 [Amanita muscaria Koide BX008]